MSRRKITVSVSTLLGVPDRLRDLQKASGLNKAGFLRLLPMKAAQWNRYESGERLPEGEVLDRIARITRRSQRWILTGAEESVSVAAEQAAPYGASAPRPEHLDPELRQIRMFTAMV
ncbi:MAG: helix-turn-helix domain-containing protein, partial [Dehalococcoidia bacterium]|nr:helix-turn-helix domain-containing protein [Dehalococcoidia bacterium]